MTPTPMTLWQYICWWLSQDCFAQTPDPDPPLAFDDEAWRQVRAELERERLAADNVTVLDVPTLERLYALDSKDGQ